MQASVSQGSDYRSLDYQAKRLQRVNDARMAADKSVCGTFSKFSLS
jgi:hypothetical protein